MIILNSDSALLCDQLLFLFANLLGSPNLPLEIVNFENEILQIFQKVISNHFGKFLLENIKWCFLNISRGILKFYQK